MTMIKPTVGRVVWFTPPNNSAESGFSGYGGQPMAATVAYVWNDRLVNLQVTDHAGVAHAKTSVPLIQDDEPKPDGYYCEWMPYQKGQAAKTEQLEKAAGSQS
jgi:hypothetical protein